MASKKPLRIGIVGAGGIARTRHLPGFAAIPGVEVVGICNKHRESSARVAREFGIAKVFGNWEALVEDETIDAVVIGTWPYLHAPVTVAALDAGKHVLTQARMAMNSREAQRMLDRSRECPNLTAMVVPSPYGLVGDAFVRKLLLDGYLGSLRELHVNGLTRDLADPSTPLGWRQMTKYSGFNMLTLGILHETALRWSSPPNRVIALASKLIPDRVDPKTKALARVGTPDSVQVLTSHEDGSRGTYRLSAVIWHPPALSIELYGSEGSIVYDLIRDEIKAAKRSSKELISMPIPEDLKGGWNVEAEFVSAIRGEGVVTNSTFETGVRYMQFTEAVARSSRHQSPVDLPLKEFSNPSL